MAPAQPLLSATMTPAGYGFTSAPLLSFGPGVATALASHVAGLGYRSFWTAETTGPSAFTTLAAVGAGAPTLDLGTGVFPLQVRSPTLAAMEGATLQALHPDRDVFVGLGVSSPVVTESWHGVPYGDRPVARVREYVALLRQLWSGDAVTFDGDFYRVRRARLALPLGERRPKVVIGALNPGMLRLAGEIADGVLLNFIPAPLVPWSVEQVRTGGDATIHAYVQAGVGDHEAALDQARRHLFGYVTVDAYAAQFERAGFADMVGEVRERHAARDRDAAVAAVSEAFVDAVSFVGDADAVRERARSYVDAGVETPVLFPLPFVGGDDAVATARTTAAAFIGA